MILVVKCWKTKKEKIVKGLFYETPKGCFLLTFDRFAIMALLGSHARYDVLKEGDVIRATACLEEEGGAT